MESTCYYQGLQSRAQVSLCGSVLNFLEKQQKRNNNSIMKMLTRNELFDLLKKDISDEMLLQINEERDQLFNEARKYRALASSISEIVQSYNRVLNANEERLSKLLTNELH